MPGTAPLATLTRPGGAPGWASCVPLYFSPIQSSNHSTQLHEAHGQASVSVPELVALFFRCLTWIARSMQSTHLWVSTAPAPAEMLPPTTAMVLRKKQSVHVSAEVLSLL